MDEMTFEIGLKQYSENQKVEKRHRKVTENLSDVIQAMLKENDLCKSTLFSYKNKKIKQ